MDIAEKIMRAKADYDAVYEAGKQAENDAFWDNYQENGNRTNYSYAFAGTGWTDEQFKPKYKIAPVGGNALEYTFYASEITEIPDDLLDFSQVNQCYMTFRQSKLVVVPPLNLTNCTNGTNWLFGQCNNLKEIKTLTVSEAVTFTNLVYGCSALEKITFAGTIGQEINFKWGTRISKASITSIIEHLSTTTSGLTVTLSKAAVETAFGSTTSTEWTTLIGTRSNWTISLI
jgi:hypothetical protein